MLDYLDLKILRSKYSSTYYKASPSSLSPQLLFSPLCPPVPPNTVLEGGEEGVRGWELVLAPAAFRGRRMGVGVVEKLLYDCNDCVGQLRGPHPTLGYRIHLCTTPLEQE